MQEPDPLFDLTVDLIRRRYALGEVPGSVDRLIEQHDRQRGEASGRSE
jgi:hypothetical protein